MDWSSTINVRNHDNRKISSWGNLLSMHSISLPIYASFANSRRVRFGSLPKIRSGSCLSFVLFNLKILIPRGNWCRSSCKCCIVPSSFSLKRFSFWDSDGSSGGKLVSAWRTSDWRFFSWVRESIMGWPGVIILWISSSRSLLCWALWYQFLSIAQTYFMYFKVWSCVKVLIWRQPWECATKCLNWVNLHISLGNIQSEFPVSLLLKSVSFSVYL